MVGRFFYLILESTEVIEAESAGGRADLQGPRQFHAYARPLGGGERKVSAAGTLGRCASMWPLQCDRLRVIEVTTHETTWKLCGLLMTSPAKGSSITSAVLYCLEQPKAHQLQEEET